RGTRPGTLGLRPPTGERVQQVPARGGGQDRDPQGGQLQGARQAFGELSRLRAERDPEEVRAALAALTEAAGRTSKADENLTDNLLAAAVDAARAKATVGEISEAMEKVFNRHLGQIRTIQGVYKDEATHSTEAAGLMERVSARVDEFAE